MRSCYKSMMNFGLKAKNNYCPCTCVCMPTYEMDVPKTKTEKREVATQTSRVDVVKAIITSHERPSMMLNQSTRV